ncbi:MAG: ATP-binding protein [Gemmatimonadota bacterium]
MARSTSPPALDRINIRPGVSVLSVLSHLNYRPWFALSEFVDNAIQSHLRYREGLAAADGVPLRVSINLNSADAGRITVRDNAAGISAADFPRAFRPAELPPDTTGLCEFGMGMKSAACWYSPIWHVRTSALGEPFERTVRFDIARIVQDNLEELDVEATAASLDSHFTEIVLEHLHHVPAGRTVGKIKEHLSEIYRIFTREGRLVLTFNGDELVYDEPEVLVSPRFNVNHEPEGDEIIWRKDLNFDFGDDLKATGFAALRKTGSTTHAGFSLFRRKRLIQGSADEKYRPTLIFGHPNDYAYQRLFGELHIEGFEVSHTKDGFQWDQNEQPFLELLRDELDRDPIPLLRQARNLRVRPTRRQLREASTEAATRTGATLERDFPAVASAIASVSPQETLPAELPPAELAARRVIDIDFDQRRWRVILELTDDRAVGDWLEVSEAAIRSAAEGADGREMIGLRMSVVHPFVARFAAAERDKLEPLVRIAAALGLAEKLAREGGVRGAGTIRSNVNKILRDALSRI